MIAACPASIHMWWNKRHDATPQEMTIRARLKKGETLQITFNEKTEPRQLFIEGWGEVRLKVKAQQNVTAELVQTDTAEAVVIGRSVDALPVEKN